MFAITRVSGERATNATGNVTRGIGLSRCGATRCPRRIRSDLLQDASATIFIPRSYGARYFLLLGRFPELDTSHVSARYFVEGLGGIPHQPSLVVAADQEFPFECLVHLCISALGH